MNLDDIQSLLEPSEAEKEMTFWTGSPSDSNDDISYGDGLCMRRMLWGLDEKAERSCGLAGECDHWDMGRPDECDDECDDDGSGKDAGYCGIPAVFHEGHPNHEFTHWDQLVRKALEV